MKIRTNIRGGANSKNLINKRLINIQTLSLMISIIGILFLVVGASYAVFTDTFKSDKKQVVEVGTTKIELIEPSTGLSLGSVEEMSDSNGLLQTNYYSFSVKNTGDSEAKYNLYLLDDADTISTYEGTLLNDKYLRVGLDKNGEELGPLNLDTQKRLIDTGLIDAGSTNNYKLRLWLNFEGLTDTEKDILDGQSKFLKLKLTGEQNFSHTLGDLIIKRDLKTNKNESNGLFSTNDTNSGKPSYYYKGAVDNNYVSFANMLWRIVRVNEDGSIRLIRQEGIDNNVSYQFNPNKSSYEKMYYSNSNVESGIMETINNWYNTNLKEYDDMIILGDFCEQAKVKLQDFSNGVFSSGNASMVPASKDYLPSLKCVIDGNGKGLLSLKVGLITIDEVVLSGIPLSYIGISDKENNTASYLIKDFRYWTMSPAGYETNAYNGSFIHAVSPLGRIANNGVWIWGNKVLPVINLKKDVVITKGNGTNSSPFEVK